MQKIVWHDFQILYSPKDHDFDFHVILHCDFPEPFNRIFSSCCLPLDMTISIPFSFHDIKLSYWYVTSHVVSKNYFKITKRRTSGCKITEIRVQTSRYNSQSCHLRQYIQSRCFRINCPFTSFFINFV